MDFTFFAGDSRNLLINVVDENNNPVDLTGATIKWILINQQNTILFKSVGSGITITNASDGQFTIAITANDTIPLNGTFQHMARVTTVDGNSSIVLTGTITVQPSFI